MWTMWFIRRLPALAGRWQFCSPDEASSKACEHKCEQSIVAGLTSKGSRRRLRRRRACGRRWRAVLGLHTQVEGIGHVRVFSTVGIRGRERQLPDLRAWRSDTFSDHR